MPPWTEQDAVMSEFSSQGHAQRYTVWDGGDTVWDDGDTYWDATRVTAQAGVAGSWTEQESV